MQLVAHILDFIYQVDLFFYGPRRTAACVRFSFYGRPEILEAVGLFIRLAQLFQVVSFIKDCEICQPGSNGHRATNDVAKQDR